MEGDKKVTSESLLVVNTVRALRRTVSIHFPRNETGLAPAEGPVVIPGLICGIR